MDSVAGVRRWGAPRISFQFVQIGLMAFCVAACGQRASDKATEPPPQQAGQPVNPYAAAAHIIGPRVAVLAGDTRAAEEHINAMARDLTRPTRIGARSCRRQVVVAPGVREQLKKMQRR